MYMYMYFSGVQRDLEFDLSPLKRKIFPDHSSNIYPGVWRAKMRV